MSKTKSRLITILVLSTVFGFLSGVVGAIIARVWVIEKTFNIPVFGEIDFLNNNLSGPNLVISGAKKVIVEQNQKINETANSLKKSIVGIFVSKSKALNPKERKTVFNINDNYEFNQEIAEGAVLTSDGWIISRFIPEKMKAKIITEEAKKEIFDEYIIIFHDRKIYAIDNIVVDQEAGFSFWHINASDLAVSAFSQKEDILPGQIMLSYDWDGFIWISNLMGVYEKKESLIKSSDEYNLEFLLEQAPDKRFWGSFIFDINGKLAASFDNKGSVDPLYSYLPCIRCLLDSKEIKRPFFGIYYVDLDDLVIDNANPLNTDKGAMIYKNPAGIAVVRNSPAYKAGFKEGDIIYSIDNINIDAGHDLRELIRSYLPGQQISVKYMRNGESHEINLILDELSL